MCGKPISMLGPSQSAHGVVGAHRPCLAPWGWTGGVRADHPDPAARIADALRLLVPAALGAAFVFAALPWASWVVFAFGWMLIPAVGQLVGGAVDLGRRAVVLPAAAAADAPSPVAIGAAPEGEANVVWRIGRGVAALPVGPPRGDAERIHRAAERLAGAAMDPVTAAAVRARVLDPTADLLARFGRLATTGRADLATDLAAVAAEFPRLAARLDELADSLSSDRTPRESGDAPDNPRAAGRGAPSG